MPEQKSVKWLYTFFIILGSLLVLIGTAFIFLGDYQNAYTQSIVGITFILCGLFFKPTIKWKEMPKGIKILVVFLWFQYFSSLWGIYTKFESFNILLGFPLQFPSSLIVRPILLIIILFILMAIYRRTWWNLVLWLQGFTIINVLACYVWMLITPLNKLSSLMGQEAPAVITQQVESLTKSLMLVPMLISLVIGIIIWIYIYKRKDYFQNQPNINPELINYIQTQEAKGYTPQQLRDYLIQQGYDSLEVDQAINYVNKKV